MQDGQSVLIGVLDQLEEAGKADTVSVAEVVETIGDRSFAALMLIFALVAVSPASVVPGVTTMTGVLELILVSQMIAGRRHLWLPQVVASRSMDGGKLRKGIDWLRRPVGFVDRLLRPRLVAMTRKPLLLPWLFLVMGLAVFMPFMEVVPGSGSLASTVIALIAAAILTRDGTLLILAGIGLGGLVWLVVWLRDTLL